MSPITKTLKLLGEDVLGATQWAHIQAALCNEKIAYCEFVALDHNIGGPSICQIDDEYGGQTYDVADRDVFRPLQYCRTYFGMLEAGERFEWLTREVVHMSGLHLESPVKRIGRVGRFPLGKTLATAQASRRLSPAEWDYLQRLNRVYVEAKHHIHHDKDTHLFSLGDAVNAYCVARQLALSLYPKANLKTQLGQFSAVA